MKKLRWMGIVAVIVFAFHDSYAIMEENGEVVRLDVEFKIPPKITSSLFLPDYDHIEMEATRSLGTIGEPQLPVKGINVLIPSGKEIDKIELTLEEKVTLSGRYKVEPAQREYPISQIGKITVTPDEPKSEIYESDTIYPPVRYKLTTASVQKKMGYHIVAIQLFPVEYNPKKGEISYYKRIVVRVRLKTSAVVKYRSSLLSNKLNIRNKDKVVVSRLIDNKEDLVIQDVSPQASVSMNANEQCKYVIVTCENFAASFEPLKQRRGQTHGVATIVTTNWIYSNYSGIRPDGKEDNQTKIRNFIISAYKNWGTRYVLLGGDGDGADIGGESGNNIIPTRGLSNLDDNNIPADLYYACLDGTFDNNSNGVYGEYDDEVDLLAEVYVGRSPVDSILETDNFVRKTLAYEDSKDDYLRNNYMVGEQLAISKYSTEEMEEIRLGASEHGFTTYGFLSNLDGALDANTLYDSNHWTWFKDKLIDIINNNVHILNHLGHSDVTHNMKLINSEVDGIQSNKYFIVYSQGCYPAAFDNRDCYGTYLPNDCIAEHFVTSYAGAVAYIGNSRYGWGSLNSTDGSSQYYNRQFWDALFGENIMELGKMNQDSKEDNIAYLNYDKNRWCYFELNLLGDPALSVNLPDDMSVVLTMDNYKASNLDNSEPETLMMELVIAIKAFNQDASDVTATLSSSDPDVIVEQAVASYGNITKGKSKDNSSSPFKFKIFLSLLKSFGANFTVTFTEGSGYSKSVNVSIDLPFSRNERQITFDTSHQRFPAISGDYIVWEDWRNGCWWRNYNLDIYLYDLSTNTERQITFDTSHQRFPAVSGNYIVWEDWRNGNPDIYLYDLSTNTERQITFDTEEQIYPAVSGNYIVWEDSRNGNWSNRDIYLYDLSTNTERQITFDARTQRNPAIFGDYIVWEDNRNGIGMNNMDIYLYDLSTNTERQITFGAEGQVYPAVSGNYIVWEDYRNGEFDNRDIYLYDLSTDIERQITFDLNLQVCPAIYGNYIVWQDWRDGDGTNTNIYLYDLSTDTERRITFNSSKAFSAISGNRVVYEDYRGSNIDIYLSVIDITKPSQPVVRDDGNFTASTTTLNASWISSDPESGIAEYRYCITQGSETGLLIKDWASAGTANSVAVGDLCLQDDKTYYFVVRARNEAWLWSEAGYSDGITVSVTDTTPPNNCSVAISNNAVYTTSTFVMLTLSAVDMGSDVIWMQFSDDNVTYSTVEPYTTLKSWTLSSGNGVKTVYVRFSDIAGNWSAAVSDSIILDTTKPMGTIKINNFIYTTSVYVTLYLSVTDTGSGVDQMQFINDDDKWAVDEDNRWSTAEPFAKEKRWTLSEGDGGKVVYARFKDAAGNWSTEVSDGIILETPKPPAGAIQINSGFAYTTSTSVTLTLFAICKGKGNSVYQMQFSDDNVTYSTVEPYTTLKSWTLSSGNGVKTVYVRFSDIAGNWSAAVSDSIILDTTKPIGMIRINNNDAFATSTSVTLNLFAADTGSGMMSGQMQFSNDNKTWSTPETYVVSTLWKLAPGSNVTKRVYAKFKDNGTLTAKRQKL